MRSFFLLVPASQHSGTVEDEHDEGEDEDALARCYICDQPFTDVDKWVLAFVKEVKFMDN